MKLQLLALPIKKLSIAAIQLTKPMHPNQPKKTLMVF